MLQVDAEEISVIVMTDVCHNGLFSDIGFWHLEPKIMSPEQKVVVPS